MVLGYLAEGVVDEKERVVSFDKDRGFDDTLAKSVWTGLESATYLCSVLDGY